MSTFKHFRDIPAPADKVFAAFSDPERSARWWGPAGFTNTYHIFEFKNGGRWDYTMHGPDGRDYPNESRFVEIEPAQKLVIEHVSLPKYRLTITLDPSDAGTRVSWLGVFENEKFAAGMEDFLKKANEQNLDRLSDEVLGK